MNKNLKMSFYIAVRKGITKVLENNHNIEKDLDWFTIKNQHDIIHD